MTIGDVFAKAWQLWRRDVGWLILAGLVVGVIIGVIAIVVVAIVAGMAAVSVGGIVAGRSSDSAGLTGVGVGTLVAAGLVGIIGYLIVSVLAMVFYGGMFEMVIGAAREDRGVEFGDLFSGFRKFSSYLVFWLVMAGISIVCALVLIIPVLGWIAVPVFLAWLTTTWLYVLPLIADRGLSFREAAGGSRSMVRNVGWWKTFAVIIVLGVAFAVIGIIISLIQRESSSAGTVLTFIFEILAFPFAICYVSTMYLQAGGEAAGLPAGAYGAPPAAPGPFAPPPPGQPAPPPPLVAPLVAPLAPPPAPPAVSPATQQVIAPPPPAPPAPPVVPPDAPPPPGPEVTAATAAGAGAVAESADADAPQEAAWQSASDPLAAPSPDESETAVEEAVTAVAPQPPEPVAPEAAAAAAEAAPDLAAEVTEVTKPAETAAPETAPAAPEPPAPPVEPGA
jgi:hypothetical protein